MDVGFIGLGVMGHPMALNLAVQGWRRVRPRYSGKATMSALAERARELEAEHALYLRVVALTVRLL